MNTDAHNSPKVKSPLELALLKLAAALGREPSGDAMTPSAMSQPPAASPAPGIASKSPSPFSALDLGTFRPYEPLTNHPDFQLRTEPDLDDLLISVFSRVSQNSNPDLDAEVR
jgi:hypothetical protein